MTSMPVKEVGMTMSKGMVKGSNTAGKMVQSGFEAVWNNQTAKSLPKDASNGTDTAREVEKTQPGSENKTVSKEEKTDGLQETPEKEKEVSDALNSNEKVSHKQTTDVHDETENLDELEKVMEVLETTALELIQQIADTFQVPAENVESAMNELGMDLLDLLQTDTFSQLVVKVGGADDSTQLLTNENLYQDYKTLMAQQENLLQEVEMTLTKSPEVSVEEGQIKELIAQVKEMEIAPKEVSEPIITVETLEQVEDVEDMEPTQSSKDAPIKEDSSMPTPMQPKESVAANVTSEKDTKQQSSNHGHGAETGTNPTVQEVKSEVPGARNTDSVHSTSAWDADTRNIMRQIMDYMRIQLKPGMSSLEMQLHPASLGNLQIQIASKGGAVTAQFVAQNETVKAALESQMIQLKESFAEQGVKVEAIEVTVQTHEFERNLDQGRGRGQSEPEKKNRIRRVQLEDGLSMEELEGMEEENRLVADMMIANGNSVDYTA